MTESAVEASGIGVTENVSPGGLYFHTPDWGALHTNQVIYVRLSGMGSYNHRQVLRSVRGRATVLRLEPPEEPAAGQAGVAVRFDGRPKTALYDLSA